MLSMPPPAAPGGPATVDNSSNSLMRQYTNKRLQPRRPGVPPMMPAMQPPQAMPPAPAPGGGADLMAQYAAQRARQANPHSTANAQHGGYDPLRFQMTGQI